MEFPAKIRFAREKMQMSQEDLARALNVSFATVNRWENSKTKPMKMARVVFEEFCNKNNIDFGDSNGK